jgi:hypothetical protein
MTTVTDLPRPVRQTTSWKPAVLLGLAAFAITILAIQLWGHVRSPAPLAKTEPVTAIVEQHSPVFEKGTPAFGGRPSAVAILSSKTVQAIKDQVTAPALLGQVCRDFWKAEERTSNLWQTESSEAEKLRRALQVDVENSPLGGKCLRLRLSWPNAQEAAKLLKALGERYAERYRAVFRNERDKEFSAIKTAADQARQAFNDSVADLEFCQQNLDFAHFAEGEPTVESRSEMQQPLAAAARQEPRPPIAASPLRDKADVENPNWMSLQKDLAEMRKKEAKLLETRTSLHPDVMLVQDQIRDGAARLAMTSRWIHPETPALRSPSENWSGAGPALSAEVPNALKKPTPLAQNAPHAANDAILLAQLEDQVEITAEAYREAAAREQAALAQRKLAPEITVRVLEPRQIAVAKTPARPPFGWLAGAMMAVGVGLICTGKALEPPVGSVKELHRLTSVPIVGVVPSYQPSIDPQAVKRKKNILRIGFFLGGLMFLGFCVWAMARIL